MEYKRATVEYRCDACGKILRGYDKNVMQTEDYISFKGTLTLQKWDPEGQRPFFVHIIPTEKSILTVCDLKCLQTYIDFQHVQYQSMRDRKLRSEASGPNREDYIPRYPHKKY